MTPSSDGSVDRRPRDGAASDDPRKKRKQQHVEEEEEGLNDVNDHLFRAPIVVKPHPPNLTVKPRVLQPLMVLPRRHLALSHLDLSHSGGGGGADLFPGRYVESRIGILEDPGRCPDAPVVLIARSESTGTLYAVEHHEGSLYVACRLGKWVDLDGLREKAVAYSNRLLLLPPLPPPDRSGRPSHVAAHVVPTAGPHRAQKRKKVVIEAFRSLVKQRSRSMSTAGEVDVLGSPAQPEDTPSAMSAAVPAETTPAPVGPKDMLENVRSQYFEALYRSMGSLAYFAKGPLSRARAAFRVDCNAATDTGHLVEFLRGMVLTTVQIDKKYRDSIPYIISQTKQYVDSSGERRQAKKRRKKKMRVAKSGLYPVEDEFVRRWWKVNSPEAETEAEAGGGDDGAAVSLGRIRARVSLLRTRETELQMILIMEILALELLCTQAGERNQESQGPTPAAVTQPATTPSRRRNKHNLPTLLDVHADRLCIWQSTSVDQMVLIGDAEGPAEAEPNLQLSSAEPLRDFCVDIVLPFFSARLPEMCIAINQKLGGPALVSNAKPAQSKSPFPLIRPAPKPGAATRRPIQAKPARSARTLESALSKEQYARRSVSRGPPSALDLMRSATATTTIPTFNILKREASDSGWVVANAPRVESPVPAVAAAVPPLPRGLGIFSRSKSFTSLDEAKARKRAAATEAEMRAAISGIRKPNRAKAGGEVAAEAERRTLGGAGPRSKPITKPTAISGPAGGGARPTVIEATPVNNRYRDALPLLPAQTQPRGQHAGMPADYDDDPIPPSSVSCIPGTAVRPGFRDAILATPCGGGGGERRDAAGLATPVKGRLSLPPPPFYHRAGIEDDCIPTSSPPFADRAAAADAVPDTTRREERQRQPLTHVGNRSIFETPVRSKPRPGPLDSQVEPKADSVPAAAPAEGRSRSIYQRLGWDHDDDDLL